MVDAEVRIARHLTAVVAVLALVVSQAPPALAAGGTVWFDGAVLARHVEPSPLWLSADGTLVVLHVRWSRWGGRVAVGTGAASYHGCTPDCGSAPVHHADVTIHLYDIVECSGRAYYNKVTLTPAPEGCRSGTSIGPHAPRPRDRSGPDRVPANVATRVRCCTGRTAPSRLPPVMPSPARNR